MPRPLNPAQIANGGGLAASNSVDASAFTNPTQGLDGLIAHIVDPSRAHEARAINLEDAGNYYSSDNVEGALQEIGSGLDSSGQNGLISGGTFSSVGLVLTLGATVVRIGTDHTLTGSTVTLANNTTNWVYITPAGVLSASGVAPSFTSPENVLLWRVVTAGGAVTSSRDARFFVPNIDRKPPFTVRSSGTAADRNAEACFESLDAAFLYLENYYGSGVIRKTKIIVRGANTLSSTYTIPVDDLILEGEDGAGFTTGAALAPMFDLNAKSRLQFRNLTFTCANVASIAIQETTGGNADILVDRCRFVSGAQDWNRGINITGATGVSDLVVRDCEITAANTGVRITRPIRTKVVDCTVSEGGSSGTAGVALGDSGVALTTEGQSSVRNCAVSGFGTSVILRGTSNEVVGGYLIGGDIAVDVLQNSVGTTVRDCYVSVDSTTGTTGVRIDTASLSKVAGCTLLCTRVAWAAETPAGLLVQGSNDIHLTDNVISGFNNTGTGQGWGVRITSTACDRVSVKGGSISSCPTAVGQEVVGSDGLVVQGVDIRAAITGVASNGTNLAVSDCRIDLDSSLGLTGIYAAGVDARITGNAVTTDRLAASFGIADNPIGIRLAGTDATAQGNRIRGFLNTTNPLLGAGYSVEAARCSIAGGSVSTCTFGIGATAADCKVTSVTIAGVITGIAATSTGLLVSNTSIDIDSTIGTTGIRVTGSSVDITGCRLTCTRVAWTGETPLGIQFDGASCKVSDTTIAGFRNAMDSLGYAVGVTGGGQFDVSNCSILSCWSGVVVTTTGIDNWNVSDCRFNGIDTVTISATQAGNVSIADNVIEDAGTTYAVFFGAGSSDLSITGNYINGSALLGTGIRIEGTDGANTRTRRVAVANNVVQNCVDDGIVLTGYVQNATVTGNSVDCFRSATPYDPTATACIRVASTGAADKARWIAITGNTCQRAKSGIVVEGLIANTVDEITVTGNTVHHCSVARASFGAGSFSDPCKGIGVLYGVGVTVAGNSVHGIGDGIDNSGVESAPVAAAVTLPVGIHAQSCIRTNVDGNIVRELHRQGGAKAYGILFTVQGNGVAVFFSSANSISKNSVTSTSGNLDFGILVNAGQAAAAASPGPSRITDTVVEGNQVQRVAGPGILLLASPAGLISGVRCAGNTVDTTTTATGTGIQVATLPQDAPYVPGIVTSVRVDGNQVATTAQEGILITADTGSALTDVSVSGNSVAIPTGVGIHVEATGIPTAFGGFTVADNRVIDGVTTAIQVETLDLDLAQVSVTGNTVVTSSNTAAVGPGIRIDTTATVLARVDMSDVVVSNNNVHVDTTNGVVVRAEGTIKGLVVASNVVRVESGNPPLAITATTDATVAAEQYSQDFSITGNTFLGGTACSLAVDQGQKLRNVTFSGNTRSGSSGHGLVVDVSDATVGTGDSVQNLTISGNVFDAITNTAVRVLLGDTVATNDPTSNVAISGNRFSNCATGATNAVVFVRCFSPVRDLSIDGNHLRLCGNADNITSGNIHVQVGSGGVTQAAENFQIRNNSINECTGVGILLEDHASASSWTLTNLSVTGNQFQQNTNDAIRLDFDAFTVARLIDVSHNIVDTIAGAASDVGIVILGPSAASLSVVSIHGNNIQTTGNGASGAITVDAASTINGLSICGNIVSPITTDNCIFVQGSDDAADLAINSNVLSNNGITGDAISLDITGAAILSACSIVGNSVSSGGGDGIGISMGTGDMRAVTISDNTLNICGLMGVHVSGSSGACNDLTIDGNSIRSTDSDGIRVFLSTGSGDVHNLSIQNNNVRNFGTGGSLTYGIRVACQDAHTSQISGNTLYTNVDNITAIKLDIQGQVRTLAISDNIVQIDGGGATTRAMYWDSGGSADQLGLSIVGNAFRGANTGVLFTGSFAPDRSVCAMNSERTSGGAGTWGTGGGGTFTSGFGANSIITPNQD